MPPAQQPQPRAGRDRDLRTVFGEAVRDHPTQGNRRVGKIRRPDAVALTDAHFAHARPVA